MTQKQNPIETYLPEIYLPENKETWLRLRLEDITSTEVACLFGVSPYSTKFELWHRKKDRKIVEIEENQRMKWGSRLQDSIAKGIAEDKGWKVRRVDEYIRIPGLRIGASFDFLVEDDKSILEIKNVDSMAFKDGWIVDGEDVQAPLHIELQLQTQLWVMGVKKGRIGALVGGNKISLLERDADPKTQASIKEKAKEFWDSIESNTPPEPDYLKDAAFITELYQSSSPGKVIPANDQISSLANDYKSASLDAKNFEDKKKAIKSQLLIAIGDAEKCIGEDFSISAAQMKESVIESFVREARRDFRINFRRVK